MDSTGRKSHGRLVVLDDSFLVVCKISEIWSDLEETITFVKKLQAGEILC